MSYATRGVLFNHHKNRKENSSEIMNYEHITYDVNTLQVEYLGPRSLWARYILNLLIWQ